MKEKSSSQFLSVKMKTCSQRGTRNVIARQNVIAALTEKVFDDIILDSNKYEEYILKGNYRFLFQ